MILAAGSILKVNMKRLLFVFFLSACSAQINQELLTEDDSGVSPKQPAIPDLPKMPQQTQDAGRDASIVLDAGTPDSSDSGELPEPEGPPTVRFLGRVNNNSFSWPGSRIIAKFNGSEVKVTLTEKAHSYWDVTIDGKLNPIPLAPDLGTGTYTLASGLTKTDHTIELWKRTEASVGTTTFVKFDLNGNLLSPPPVSKRRLEFLTDSASNGFGIEGKGPACLFEPDTENEHKAYPALLGTALKADYHHLGASGKGVLRNYSPTDTEVFSVLYDRSSQFIAGSKWDHKAFQVDVVFIVLGGNDYSLSSNTAPPDREAFENKYLELVKLVRSRQPNAHIFCGIAPSLKDNYPAGYNTYTNIKMTITNVSAAMAKVGDEKVYPFEFSRSTAADLTGCVYHPNITKHQSMAAEALVAIKSKTGWN